MTCFMATTWYWSSTQVSYSGFQRWGETPVPIPNTPVKPSTADGSAATMPCESRLLPGLWPVFSERKKRVFFCLFLINRDLSLPGIAETYCRSDGFRNLIFAKVGIGPGSTAGCGKPHVRWCGRETVRARPDPINKCSNLFQCGITDVVSIIFFKLIISAWFESNAKPSEYGRLLNHGESECRIVIPQYLFCINTTLLQCLSW